MVCETDRVLLSGKTGDIYVGNWKDDLQDGRGKLTKKSGDIFEGEFRKGQVNGEVIIHYANGNRFKGVYRMVSVRVPASRKPKKVNDLKALTVTTAEKASS